GLVVASRRKVENWAVSRQAMSIGAHTLARASLFLSGRRPDFDLMSGYFGMRRDMAMRLDEKRIVLPGYKILFDMFKQLPATTAVSVVPYDFGMRKKGQSKIGARHIAYFLKSLLS
ncbi:MAG TPA: glycosyltransferase family 2 protein, partial [Candidatus Micrarchaeota archaeon]|nr:glycosyltransferase family 2 protein [Candidatus Micrarchaeota archaeon]